MTGLRVIFWRGAAAVGGWMMGEGGSLVSYASAKLRKLEGRE